MDTPVVQSAREEKDATIRCEVRGNPEPQVSWQLNGQQITLPNSRYEKLADGLLIRKVSVNDQGEYTCKAYQVSTAISSVLEQSITLKIQHKPRPTSPQRVRTEEAYGFISGVVNLTCEAIANPPADFIWLRNKLKIVSNIMTIFPGEQVSALQIPINDEKAFGNYTCRATNPLGTLDKVFNLQEGVKPDPPNHWGLRGANSDTIDIEINSATPINVDVDDLMHQIIGYRFQFTTLKDWKADDESWINAKKMDFGVADGATYLLPGLAHDTVYVVRVASRNAAGHSDYSPYQEFRTSRLQPHGVSSAIVIKQTYMQLVILSALAVVILCQ